MLRKTRKNSIRLTYRALLCIMQQQEELRKRITYHLIRHACGYGK